MKFWRPLVIILISIINVQFVNAHHYAGAEFTYSCTTSTPDSSTYEIELTVYRDCASGILFSSYYTAFYESLGCTPNSQPQKSIVLTPNGGDVEITKLCPGELSNCNDPFSSIIGIKKRTYSANVTIAKCDDWYFWWRDQSRNTQNLSNVNGQNEQDMLVEMHLNNSTYSCNSSYTFSDSALITEFFCIGTQYQYDFSADINNPDGDSLSYHLVQPLKAPGITIDYELGFDYLNPISTSNGFNLNSSTGVLTFTPTAYQSSILSLEIREYKNGSEIGRSTRDMQIFTRPCTNTPPELTGINGTDEDTVYMCINTEQKVYLFGFDQDSGQTVNVSVLTNNLPNNSTVYDTTNGQVIIWEPDTSQGGTYTITFRVDDDGCPYPQTTQKTIYFIVDTTLNAQCNCSRARFTNYTICGEPTLFTNQSYSAGGEIISWLWNFDDPASGVNNTSTLENPTHLYANSGLYNVTLTWIDDRGCTKSFTKPVVVCQQPVTQISIHNRQWCEAPGRVIYRADCDAGPYCTQQGFSWSVEGDTTVIDSYLLYDFTTKYYVVEYSQPGFHIVTVDITVYPSNPEYASAFCSSTETDTFYIHPKPDLTLLDSSFMQRCTPDYDTFFVAQSADIVDFQWFVNDDPIPSPEGTNDTLLTSTEDLTLSPDIFNHIKYNILVTDTTTGCINKDSLYVFDPIKPNFYVTPFCNPGDSVIFVDTSQNSMYYNFVGREWDFGDGNPAPPLDTSNFITHFYNLIDTVFYPTLFVEDDDNCFDIATHPIVRLDIPDSNISIISGDSDRTICYYERDLTFFGPNEKKAEIGKWVWLIDDTSRVDSIVVWLNDSSTKANDKYLHFYYKDSIAFIDSLKRSTPVFSRTYLPEDTGLQYISVSIHYNYSYDSHGKRIDSLYCFAGPFLDSINLRPNQEVQISGGGECIKDTFNYKAVKIEGDNIYSWFWDFNDKYGNTIYSANDTLYQLANSDSTFAKYKYSNYSIPDFGRRKIFLNTIDEYGCEYRYGPYLDTAVTMAPQDFFWDNNCSDNSIELTPVSADSNCINCWENISLFQWDFGVEDIDTDTASQVAYGAPVNYTYDSLGIYNIILAVSHPAGYHNCIDTVQKQIVINAAPEVNFNYGSSVCLGDTTLFINKTNPMFTFEYDSINNSYTGNTFPAEIVNISFKEGNNMLDLIQIRDSVFGYSFQSYGLHDSILIEVESSNGCIGRQYISPYVSINPNASFYFDELPVASQSVDIISNSNWFGENLNELISHKWIISDSRQNILYADSGYDISSISYLFENEQLYNVYLEIYNEHNCFDDTLVGADALVRLDFPTAFSPNNEGNPENDVFRLHHKGIKELKFYRIFNRYGEVVFDGGNDLSATWDGKYKGRKQEQGMYVCVVQAVDIFGREHNLKKNVLLVK